MTVRPELCSASSAGIGSRAGFFLQRVIALVGGSNVRIVHVYVTQLAGVHSDGSPVWFLLLHCKALREFDFDNLACIQLTPCKAKDCQCGLPHVFESLIAAGGCWHMLQLHFCPCLMLLSLGNAHMHACVDASTFHIFEGTTSLKKCRGNTWQYSALEQASDGIHLTAVPLTSRRWHPLTGMGFQDGDQSYHDCTRTHAASSLRVLQDADLFNAVCIQSDTACMGQGKKLCACPGLFGALCSITPSAPVRLRAGTQQHHYSLPGGPSAWIQSKPVPSSPPLPACEAEHRGRCAGRLYA